MQSASRVVVEVRDHETGEPIEGAHVGLVLTDGDGDGTRAAELRECYTDLRGRGDVEVNLSAGEDVRVRPVARATGYAERNHCTRRGPATGFQAPRLTSGETVHLELTLERGTTIRGVVRGASGEPIERAAIQLVLSLPRACAWPHAFAVSESVRWPPPCRTDEAGRFEWLSLPIHAKREGRFVLLVEHPDFEPAMVHDVETLAAGAGGVIDLSVVLRTGVGLDGVVRGPTGERVVGARVELVAPAEPDQPVCVRFEKSGRTDGEGRFSLRGLKCGVHRVDVEASGHAPHTGEVDVTKGGQTLSLDLASGSDLEGTVLDVEGRPAADARIVATDDDRAFVRRTQSNESGAFRLRGLPAEGTVTLRSAVGTELEVRLPSGPVTLRPGERVHLSVVVVATETGDPLTSGGRVYVFGPGFSSGGLIDGDGRMDLTSMPSGRYELVVDARDRAPTKVEVELPSAGLSDPVVVRVPRGGLVSGRVCDEAGRALGGVSVIAYGRHSTITREDITDEAGRFELRGLGEFAGIACSLSGHAVHAEIVRGIADGGRPTELDVTLGEGATVRGRVLDREGEPVAGARVSVARPEVLHPPWELPSALTSEAGEFELAHVPPGEVLVQAGGASRLLSLSHGDEIEVELAES